MGTERVIRCGGASAAGPEAQRALEFRIYGPHPNVHFRVGEFRRAIWTDVPPAYRDLIDIALYVYVADQAVPRPDRLDGKEIGAGWRRKLTFHVPVRVPDLWNSPRVRDALVATLSFLSEDEYDFVFTHLRKDTSLSGHLDFCATAFDDHVEEVILFSGGLDSLAGAAQESVRNRRRVLLVNHRSTDKMERRHQQLLAGLARHAGDRAPVHFPVRANKNKGDSREPTQRSRSFLYAAFAAMFAAMIGLYRIRFYENGVLSLNLPLAGQVVGARASRTTHPRVLAGFRALLGAVAGRPFAVENPFVRLTKTEVVRVLGETDCADLIRWSTSCANTRTATHRHPHCGLCSQCIDRRFAVLAAGLEAHDPHEAYRVDLLTGDRREVEARLLLAGYLDLANRVEAMGGSDFVPRFGEVARALRHLGPSPEAAAVEAFDLYRRHARQVTGVVEAAIAAHRRNIRRRALPPNCLLRLVLGSETDGPTEPPAPPAPPPAKNYFERRGRAWVIGFNGGEGMIYFPERGFDYLQILFECPGEYTAARLASTARRLTGGVSPGAAGAEGLSTGGMGADPVMDEEAYLECRVRLAEVEARLEALGGAADPLAVDEIDALEHERDTLRAELARGRGFKGKERKLAAEQDRIRNKVCHALRRAIAQIGQYDAALAEHLTRPILTLGHTIVYAPPEGVTWSVCERCPSERKT